jgi:hypothetical protein
MVDFVPQCYYQSYIYDPRGLVPLNFKYNASFSIAVLSILFHDETIVAVSFLCH